MKTKVACSVEGCERTNFARGYCRKHYGQMWRRGYIYSATQNKPKEDDDTMAINIIREEYSRAKQLYNNVVGTSALVRCRQRLNEIEQFARDQNIDLQLITQSG